MFMDKETQYIKVVSYLQINQEIEVKFLSKS